LRTGYLVYSVRFIFSYSALCRLPFPLIDINRPDGVFALSPLVSKSTYTAISSSSVPLPFLLHIVYSHTEYNLA
jgi:hypothetical protein